VDKKTPVFVATSSQLVKLSTGGRHACGIVTGGAAVCWGSNASGQLGDGTTTSSQRPVAVTTSAVAVEIGVGSAHSCFVSDAFEVFCFGDASQGQVGPGGASSSTPQAVTGL
jgi:alpha-tubulin suppressor-like RCC1 family protein